MSKDITLKTPIELGILPTHAKFVGGLVPEADGRLPRTPQGGFVVAAAVRDVIERSRVAIQGVQVPLFMGAADGEWDALTDELKALGLAVHYVIMLGDVDPMNPADEDEAVARLVNVIQTAKRNGVRHLAATSVELWMQPGAQRKEGAEFDTAVAQLVKLHTRAYLEGGVADSAIEQFDVEFLRPGEFQTFTDLGRIWTFIKAVNQSIGRPFFKCLVDAAHCGDSALDIPETRKLVAEIAAGGGLGMIHCSAKTTRGCLSTDDGWVAALLAAAAPTGQTRMVYVEMFHHQDDALAPLRAMDPGHGIDTLDGRDYTQVVADGLTHVARILNNLAARGILPTA